MAQGDQCAFFKGVAVEKCTVKTFSGQHGPGQSTCYVGGNLAEKCALKTLSGMNGPDGLKNERRPRHISPSRMNARATAQARRHCASAPNGQPTGLANTKKS